VPTDLAVNTALNLVYVLCASYPNETRVPSVKIVDGTTGTLIRSIAVGPRPTALALSEFTGRLYVSDGYTTISMFESPW